MVLQLGRYRPLASSLGARNGPHQQSDTGALFPKSPGLAGTAGCPAGDAIALRSVPAARSALPFRETGHGGHRSAALSRRHPAEDAAKGDDGVYATLPFRVRSVGLLFHRADGGGGSGPVAGMLSAGAAREGAQLRRVVWMAGEAAVKLPWADQNCCANIGL